MLRNVDIDVLDNSLELELFGVPEVGVSYAVRFIRVMVAVRAMKL